MQEFYKKALLSLIVLLLVDLLLAVFFVDRADPTRTLLPAQKGDSRWEYLTYSDGSDGGASSVRLPRSSKPPTALR